LELAAAWSQTLTPAQMLERLERRFDLLVSRRRDLPDRHRTLRAAIEWSWNLLSPDLQAFFAQLSAFRGGWTLDAAEAVTGEARTLEYLAELRERSFIVTEAAAPPDEPCAPTGTSSESTNSAAAADDGALRFRMLETLREFAGEQVGDDAARSAVADWHARYFAALAEEAEPKLHGPEQVAWLCRLTREYDNLRAALAWSLDDREQRAEDGNDEQIADLGLRLAGALARYWLVRGHADEGRAWLGKALAAGDGSPVLRARALRGAWALAWRRRDRDEAVRLAEAGLALGRAAGNDADAAFFLGTLGLAAYLSDEPQRARALLEQAVALARQVGDDWLTGQCLCWLGTVLIAQGQDGPAGQVLNEGLAALDAQGDIYGSAIVLRMLGLSLLGRGNLDGARQRTEQSIARFRELDDPAMIGSSTLMLGFIAYDEKDFVAARAHFDTALDRCRAVGDRFGMAHAWHNRAHVFLAEHEYAATRQDLAQSLAVFHDLHFGGDVALSLEAFARLACAEEHWERALELTGATDTLRKAIGLPLPNIHRAKRDEDATRARQALGDVRADAALARGRRLTTEQAVRAALEPTGD
jgi:tetratricopeptide (TPR) repeat protein